MGMKEELMKKLHAPGVEYYSFTTDGWSTDVATHSMISLTAYRVEQDFTKMSAVFCVKEMEGSHTGSAICAKFCSMLSEWGIEKHSIRLVLRDNAANMEKAMRDAAITSYGCFAHSLQLVVNDGALVQRCVNELFAVCRRIVGHFRRSTLAYGKLKEIQKNLGLPRACYNIRSDKLFTNGSSRQFSKTLLVGEYLHTKEEVEVSEPAAKSCFRRGRQWYKQALGLLIRNFKRIQSV